MIDSESPFTRVQTNFLPVQPVYTEPCKLFYRLKLFAVQNFTRFRESRVRKRKANPCKILSVQKLFLDSSKRVLKAISYRIKQYNIIIKCSYNGPTHVCVWVQSLLQFVDSCQSQLVLNLPTTPNFNSPTPPW